MDSAVRTCLRLINEIKRSNVKASISVKATQLGLLIDKRVALRNYARIVNSAKRNGIFTWLDMEGQRYVDATIRLYKSQVRKGMVGITIQAYLKRSARDVEELVGMGGAIRLVKGSYNENDDDAFSTWEETTDNYIRIMEYLFKREAKFEIATHDPKVIADAIEMKRSYRENVVFAMLSGTANKVLVGLAKSGNKTVVYIPFGKSWLSYIFRKLRGEGNVLAIRSLLESQKI